MHPILCIPLLLSWSFNFPNFPNHIIKCPPLLLNVTPEPLHLTGFTYNNKRRKQNRWLTGAEKCASRVNSQAAARLRIALRALALRFSVRCKPGVTHNQRLSDIKRATLCELDVAKCLMTSFSFFKRATLVRACVMRSTHTTLRSTGRSRSTYWAPLM